MSVRQTTHDGGWADGGRPAEGVRDGEDGRAHGAVRTARRCVTALFCCCSLTVRVSVHPTNPTRWARVHSDGYTQTVCVPALSKAYVSPTTHHPPPSSTTHKLFPGFPPIREIREHIENFFQSGKSGQNKVFSAKVRGKFSNQGNVLAVGRWMKSSRNGVNGFRRGYVGRFYFWEVCL